MAPESNKNAKGAATRGRTSPGLALLSFAAGSMDAIAFLALGGVFTSAMSGNTIVLGLAAGQGHLGTALHAATALLGYLTGVAASSVSLVKTWHGSGWTLGLEGVFLAGFAGMWFAGETPSLYILILLSAVAMGLQGGIARAIGAPGIMTVIFTSTYTTLVSNFVERALTGDRPLFTAAAVRQLAALFAYFGGAIIAAIVTTHWRKFAPFLPLVAIVSVLAGLKLRFLDLDQKPS